MGLLMRAFERGTLYRGEGRGRSVTIVTDTDAAEAYGGSRKNSAPTKWEGQAKGNTMSFLSGFFGPGIDELAAQARETPGSIMIDVRTPDEYRDGHIEGAVSIPLVSIPATAARRLPDKDAPIYAYCLSGARSAQACRELERQGYTNVVNMGGRRPLVRRPAKGTPTW